MYVPCDFAFESEILSCFNMILPRETREAQDTMKSI